MYSGVSLWNRLERKVDAKGNVDNMHASNSEENHAIYREHILDDLCIILVLRLARSSQQNLDFSPLALRGSPKAQVTLFFQGKVLSC